MHWNCRKICITALINKTQHKWCCITSETGHKRQFLLCSLSTKPCCEEAQATKRHHVWVFWPTPSAGPPANRQHQLRVNFRWSIQVPVTAKLELFHSYNAAPLPWTKSVPGVLVQVLSHQKPLLFLWILVSVWLSTISLTHILLPLLYYLLHYIVSIHYLFVSPH